MTRILSQIDPDKQGDHSTLFLDYVSSGAEGLPPYLEGLSAKPNFWKKKLAKPRDDKAWREVVSEITTLSRTLGAGGDIIDKLGRDGTQFVVTGQQPGTLGGPLHTLYKVATAVVLARMVEDKTGAGCVPLYWCGADDTDFQEIRQLYLACRDGTPVSTSIQHEAHHSGVPVGDIAIEWVRRVWEAVLPVIGDFGEHGFVEEMVNASLACARDHGQLSSAILVRLFGGGLAVVDGRSGAVRRCAGSLFVRYIEQEDAVKEEVSERGARLEAAGYHAQLGVGADSGVFLLEEGRRKSVGRDRRDVLLATAKNHVERCSPGVVLRNLVQDFVFRPVAAVVGPAELAYRAQIGTLYQRFGVPVPAHVPRMSATLIPPDFLAMLDSGGGDVDTLVTDPAAFARSVYRHSLPPAIETAYVDLTKRINEALDDYTRVVDEVMPAKATGKMQGRLAEIRTRTEKLMDWVEEAGKTVARERWPFVSSLDQVIRPLGKPQDRTLSALSPCLWGGAAAVDAVTGLATSALDELLDGRSRHIVYSTA